MEEWYVDIEFDLLVDSLLLINKVIEDIVDFEIIKLKYWILS